MKLSVSIPDDDVAFLDTYVISHNVGSRSAALQRAIRLLQASQLTADYAEAFAEWDEQGHASVWETVVGDGLIGHDETR